jgi:YVTN family beta-propeller protein
LRCAQSRPTTNRITFTYLSLARQRIAVADAVKILQGDNGEKMVRNQTCGERRHRKNITLVPCGEPFLYDCRSSGFCRAIVCLLSAQPNVASLFAASGQCRIKASTVSVIDTTMDAVIATTPVGLVPDGVAVVAGSTLPSPLRTPYRLSTRTV